jgi:hypothetical protein
MFNLHPFLAIEHERYRATDCYSPEHTGNVGYGVTWPLHFWVKLLSVLAEKCGAVATINAVSSGLERTTGASVSCCGEFSLLQKDHRS